MASEPAEGAQPWRRWGSGLAALLAAVCVAFSDVLGPARGLLFRDHALVFRQRWGAVTEALAAGQWPALTRANSGGIPLEHLLNGTYTPLTLVFGVADFAIAYDLFVVAHFAVLGAGVLAFARAVGARVEAALAAAAVATLSGPVLSTENVLVMLQGLTWVPWVGVALVRAWRPGGGPGWAVGVGGLALGFHLQSIIPTVAALDVVLALALAAHLRPSARGWAAAVGIVAIGLAVSSVELMPVLGALAGTERGQGFTAEAQSGWSFGAASLAELLCPSFWFPPEHATLQVPTATGNPTDPPYFVSLYFGSALAIAFAGGVRGRARALLWAAVALSVLIAMGHRLPLHGWLTSLPILESSRYAIKYTVVTSVALSALVALALPRVIAEPRRLALAAFAQATCVGCLLLVVRSGEYEAWLRQVVVPLEIGVDFAGETPAADAQRFVAAQAGRAVGALAAALSVLAIALLAAFARVEPRRTAGLLAAAVTLDLAFAGVFAVHGADLSRHALPARAADLLPAPPARFALVYPSGRLPPLSADEGGRFDAMMTALGQRAHHAAPRRLLWFDLGVDGQSHPLHERTFALANRQPLPTRFRIFERLGVSRVVSPAADLPLADRRAWPVDGGPPQYVYALDHPTPYVQGYTAWTAVPRDAPDARWVAALTRPAPTGIVSRAPAAGLEAATSTTSAPVAIEVLARGDGRVHARVEAPARALIVLREVALGEWTARVGDDEAPVLEAEAGFVAVFVPPGRHEVRFTYRPALRRYVGIALAGCLAAVLALGLATIRFARTRAGGKEARGRPPAPSP